MEAGNDIMASILGCSKDRGMKYPKVVKREIIVSGRFKYICLWYSDGSQKIIGSEIIGR